ncbi:unnamed protein product [Protopolystoma xenopodis]|uniref:Cation-transporting P-type ATPase C-terminal domain-containing protein n=1 Tax=Protopolystoma xenopodis TaxID=117903 RepID=A0A3S5CH06_9PLAT|nr:unnamed protein product [Protopolystoma xenopodis]
MLVTERPHAQPLYFAKGALDRLLPLCIYYNAPSKKLLSLVPSGGQTVQIPGFTSRPFYSDNMNSLSYNEDYLAERHCEPLGDLVTLGQSGESLFTSWYSPSDKTGLHILDNPHRQRLLEAARNLGLQGLRVLAVAEGLAPNALSLIGLVGIHDPPRPGVHDSVDRLLCSGVRVVMITGDAKETACSARLSLYKHGDICLSGDEVECMEESSLRALANSVTVFYRAGPRHKCKIVKVNTMYFILPKYNHCLIHYK